MDKATGRRGQCGLPSVTYIIKIRIEASIYLPLILYDGAYNSGSTNWRVYSITDGVIVMEEP